MKVNIRKVNFFSIIISLNKIYRQLFLKLFYYIVQRNSTLYKTLDADFKGNLVLYQYAYRYKDFEPCRKILSKIIMNIEFKSKKNQPDPFE